MKVRAFKLTNGDEIIAEVCNTSIANGFTIKRPLALRQQMTQGGPQLGFFPWAMMLDDSEEVILKDHSWFITYEPAAEIKNDYIKNVTGIDIISAPTQILHS